MANRLKEDEKNERIIRGLLKLPANRRCINCGSLGPQYVCTNFWTFVCTNCSGIHREFTHRVKSISMAKFTSQEVSALQEGGNQRAKEVYFKEWDPQSYSLPDSSNVDRLRNFIKHVYVDRRFTGERTYDKSKRVNAGDKDNFYENRRVDPYQGAPKSPPYEDTYEHRYNDRSSPGGRSTGYDQESRQYSNDKRSPGHPPIINDWHREDRFRDGRRFEDRRISDGDYKLEGQLPEQANNLDSSSPPVVRPVRDILGENVVPLRISEPPKTNSTKANDGSALTQRIVSSSSLASSNGNPAEVKVETTKSLIDFDAEPEPSVAATISHIQQTTAAQSIVEQPNSSDDNNWASFDVALEAKATQAPSNVNTLESMLSQLSVSASLPALVPRVQGNSSVVTPIPGGSVTLPKTGNLSVSPAGHVPASSLTATAAGVATASSFSTFPSGGASVAAPGLTTVLQQQQPMFPPTVGQSSTHQFTPPVVGALNNQSWNVPPAPTVQGHLSISMPHASHLVSKPVSETSSGIVSQPYVEVKPSGRRELPEDLFTLKYSFPTPVPGWQMGPPHGMGISMPYNTAPMPSFQQLSKLTNPFDIGCEPPPVQTPTFPLISSLQGALPRASTSGVMHPSSVGNPSAMWNPPQSSSYGSVMPLQIQPHSSAMAPRPYVGQQMQMNTAMPRHQEIGSFGAEGVAFGFSNLDRQLTGTFTAPASSNLSSTGGNPFG